MASLKAFWKVGVHKKVLDLYILAVVVAAASELLVVVACKKALEVHTQP